jgi:hypothetical protein
MNIYQHFINKCQISLNLNISIKRSKLTMLREVTCRLEGCAERGVLGDTAPLHHIPMVVHQISVFAGIEQFP